MTRMMKISVPLILAVTASAAAAQGFRPPPATVVVEEARLTHLAPTVDVPGTVYSKYDARLASELAAKLEWIAEVGTRVEKGETVARLEEITFRLLEMEAQSRGAKEEARVKFLRSEKARLERLSESNLSARSQLDQTISDLAAAEGDKAIAEAQLGQAKVAMYVTQIRAPFDGVVTERLRNIGERLNVSDQVIRVVDPRSIEVVARAPLNTVNFIREGDELRVFNDYRESTAPVRTIVPFGNPQSHMFEVRLNADPDQWTVGESVRVAMPTAIAKEVLTVPRDALVLRRNGSSVFRINDDMKAEQINVITGLGAGDLIEVIGDVNPGDRIVVRGAERLNTGADVMIKDEPAAGAASVAQK